MREKFEQSNQEDIVHKKEEQIPRRKFLRNIAGTSAGFVAGSAFGGEIPIGQEGIKYAKEQTKELSAEQEKAPGFGIFEKEALIFQYLIMPQNEAELSQFKEFLKFVHGVEYRRQVLSQMTMYEKDPEDFDKKGWEFYKKYFGDKKMAKITPKSVDSSEIAKRYEALKKIGAEDILEYSLRDISSKWDGKEITIDMSDFRFKELPPSVVVRHEADHVSQESEDIYFAGISTARECICIFDGIEMALIDKQLRKENNLSAVENEKKELLYSKSIKFPSGVVYTVRSLIALSEKFFSLNKSEPFKETFVQILSNPVAVSFFNNLIYGNPGRSNEAIKKWQKTEKQRGKEIEDFDKNKEVILKEYIKRFIDQCKNTPGLLSQKELEAEEERILAELKSDPEKLHAYLVEILAIKDDPKYSLRTIYGGGNLVQSYPLYQFSKPRNETDVLRDVIAETQGVEEFWHKNGLIVDIDPRFKEK